MDILQSVMDSSSHAMFTMDRQGIVTHINRQAKERFGLFNHSIYSHPAGRLEPGDIVILGTSVMGADDGNLAPEDLTVLGIQDHRLHGGDMLAAVGVYQGAGVKPVYKYLRSGAAGLSLDVTFQGMPINVKITDREISVTVQDRVYTITYFICIGQMVVLDRRTKKVKFWEEKGYSARKEGIGSLLRGGSFIAKSPEQEICVVGYHFREFFEGELFEEHLRQVLDGRSPGFADMAYEINGFALLASIMPIHDGGQVVGIIVKFRNIEDIRTTIMERNTAIAAAERKFRESSERSLPGEVGDALLGCGSSAAMRAARRRAYKLSQMDCNIFITGEPGTGRTKMAQSIQRVQPRGGPFVRADCSAIDPALLDAELFGREGGQPGLFREADGGTLLLDEVGEMPLSVQAKLLNAIRRGEVLPVGAARPVTVDVRLLAIAGPNLRDEVETGHFRQDLYYRLSAFSVEMPPLRDCREDIYLMANELMEQICQRYGMPEKSLSGEAFSKLINYDWPGNLRELENVLEGAAALSDSDIIYPEHIRLETEPAVQTLRQHLRQEERRYIQQTLAQCGGDRQQAMKLLDVSRSVFYERLKEYGLH